MLDNPIANYGTQRKVDTETEPTYVIIILFCEIVKLQNYEFGKMGTILHIKMAGR